MMKKIIPFIMAVFMAIPLLAQQTVELGDVDNAVPGEIIEVPLYLYDFDNVGAITLHIAFDGYLLGWSEFLFNSTDFPGVPVPDIGLAEDNKRLLFGWQYTEGLEIDGLFGTFTFEYRGFFPGTLEFIVASCEIADPVGDQSVFTITYTGAHVSQDPNLDIDGSATIGDASAIAAGNVLVPVSLTHINGFNGVAKALDLRVGYDSSKLTFVGLQSVHPGFNADEIIAGGDLIITNFNLPDGFVFDGNTPLFNLEFQYWGGGDAAVNFLTGSIITDQFTNILVTEFGSGVVVQQDDHGSLTIAKYVSTGAVTSTIDPLIIEPDPVELTITAEGLDDIDDMGLVHLKIAYDKEKLEFTGPIPAPPGWSIESETAGLLTLTKEDIDGFTINDGVLFTLEFDYLYIKVEDPPDPQTYYSESLANVEFQVGTYLLKTDGTPVGPELIDGWVSMVMPGDVNCDGQVNLQDILLLINYIYPPYTDLPCEAGYIAADVNGDGIISLADLLLLINIVYPPAP